MSHDFVYFIKPTNADGPIKIGCSRRPDVRLDNLMAWSPLPLEIEVMIPGDLRLEGRIHATFERHHSHREWFAAAPELLALIRKLKSGVPIEEAIELSSNTKGVRSYKKETSGWTEEMRAYRGYVTKVHFAVRRASKSTGIEMWEPSFIGRAISELRDLAKAQEDFPTDLIARIESFLREPEKFCRPRNSFVIKSKDAAA